MVWLCPHQKLTLNCNNSHMSREGPGGDRKSTRLNSSHQIISYAVFCLKKKKIIGNRAPLALSRAVPLLGERKLDALCSLSDRALEHRLDSTFSDVFVGRCAGRSIRGGQ